MAQLAIVLAAALTTVAACNLTKLKSGFCHTDNDCKTGWRCDFDASWECINPDAGVRPDADAGEVGDGGDARDGADAQDAFSCNRCGDAGADGGPSVCDFDASMCVECLADGDCNADGGIRKVCDTSTRMCVGCLPTNDICTGTSPICSNQICRPCASDTECDSGVCMVDGHCAGSGEIVFVDYSSATCPGNGDTGTPFCTIPAAMPSLTSARNVLVIRGPADDKLMLNTMDVRPVVVGKRNSSGAEASVPAGAGTAILVGSDQVFIRDLIVKGATADSSKGIVATGASTILTLVNVTVNLTVGLGIQVGADLRLRMNRCVVSNNPRGGIQLGTLNFDITNTVIAKNGPGTDTGGVTWGGLRINATGIVPSSTRFVNNTIVENNAVAFSCATDVSINQSIVFGNTSGDGAGCTIATCCSAGNPLLTSTYRLTTGSPCLDKIDTAMSLPDDIDGQARPNGVKSDCGADEL